MQLPKLSEEERAEISARGNAVLADHVNVLRVLYDAASGYFGKIVEGRAYKRSPGLKVTVLDPPAGEDDREHRLLISPAVNSRRGKCLVDPSDIVLRLCRDVPSPVPGTYKLDARLIVRLERTFSFDSVIWRRGLYCPHTADVDAARLCAIATRFVTDPAEAVAASGSHCSFCGRALTDPESRRRGIGPECFGKFGDFLKFLRPLDLFAVSAE